MGKHHRTLFRVINRMDQDKRATKKEKLSHGDPARGVKTTRILGASRIVFGLTDDLIDLIERHLLRKKSKAIFCLKKYAAKQKAEGNLCRGLKVTIVINLTCQLAKKGWR